MTAYICWSSVNLFWGEVRDWGSVHDPERALPLSCIFSPELWFAYFHYSAVLPEEWAACHLLLWKLLLLKFTNYSHVL